MVREAELNMVWKSWLGTALHGNACSPENIVEIDKLEDIPMTLEKLLKKYEGRPLTEITFTLDMETRRELYNICKYKRGCVETRKAGSAMCIYHQRALMQMKVEG